MNPLPLALLASALLIRPVAAQEEASPVFREEIVVAAERASQPQSETTAAVSVITREDIEARPVETLAEALESIPGFHVLFSSASGSVPILASRGFFGGGEVEYVQVRVDGVPVGDVESGLVDLSRFRASEIDRIEVLRGAGSSLYGDTALGGVIDVTTGTNSKARSVLLSVSGGSFSSLSTDLSFDSRPWHLSLAHSGGDGYRNGSDHQLDNLDLRWRSSDRPIDWSAALSLSRRDIHDPGLLSREEIESDPTQTDPIFRFDEESTDRYRLAASFSRPDGPIPISGELHGAYKDLDSIRTLLIVAGFGDTIARALETSAGEGSIRGEHASKLFGRDLATRAGIDLGYETMSSRYRAVGEEGTIGQQVAAIDGNRRRAGVYLTEEWRAAGRLSIHGGIRFDRIDDDFRDRSRRDQAWSPRLGVNARVHASEQSITSLFAQISRAFKAPTVDQRFDRRPFPDFQGGSFTISNPELRPQRANSLEIGLAHHQQRLRGQLALYRIEVGDEIDFDAETFVYRNIGRSVHQGFELSLGMDAPFIKPRIDYAWSRVWIPSVPDNQLKNMPEHLLRAGGTFDLPLRMRLDLAGRWIAGRFLDDNNARPMPDVTLFDARLQREIGRMTAHVDVRNLGDEHYEEAGLTLPDSQGNPVPYANPGAGREWRVGLQVEF